MKQTKYIKSIILLLVVILATGTFAGNKQHHKKRSNIQRGWYIRLIATSDDLKDTSTVFGYLKGASDQKDKYDSEALSSGGGHYLYTTINHPEFEGSEEYKSDYRAFQKTGNKSDTWTIVVHSSDNYGDVTLSWDGVTWVRKKKEGGFREKHYKGKRILGRSKLIDEANGEVIDTKAENSYTFNMDGSREHTLKWVLLKDGEEEPTIAEPEVATLETMAMPEEREEASETETAVENTIPTPKKKHTKKRHRKRKEKHHKQIHGNSSESNTAE